MTAAPCDCRPGRRPGRAVLGVALSALVACGGEADWLDPDAGLDDAGSTDSGREDGGGADAGSADAGSPDAGSPDAGQVDGGRPDAGSPDAGTPDGGRPDAGPPDAGPPDGGRPDAGPPDAGLDVLASRVGTFFTPSTGTPMLTIDLGGRGTTYQRVQVCFEVLAGNFQPHRPDPSNREEHILFGLARNAPQSWGRYLMGSAAVTFLNGAPHFRMFGRLAIEDRGNLTYTTYKGVSGQFSWVSGTTYRQCCSLDPAADLQRCQLWRSGSVVATRDLAIPYLDPATHLTSGLSLQLGATPNSGGIENSPIGWAFSNLVVTAFR